MNVSVRCHMCDCRALITLGPDQHTAEAKALWPCPLCKYWNKTALPSQVVAVRCQCSPEALRVAKA
jgi:hypothetical protein